MRLLRMSRQTSSPSFTDVSRKGIQGEIYMHSVGALFVCVKDRNPA